MSTPTPPAGFVLAGGKSCRMGRDKALLDWHGFTVLEHMIALLRTVSVDVQTVGRQDLPDNPIGLGPLGGIATALCASNYENNLVVAVDLPLLTKDFLKYFKEHFERSAAPLTACRIDSVFPLCLGVRKSALPSLNLYLSSGRRSLHGWIETLSCEILTAGELADAGHDRRIFANMNTEADYRTAQANYKP